MDGKKVLVVDDEVELARVMGEALAAHGYVVEIAHDGLEALEKARIFSPDAIVLDVMLPAENGYRVARAIKGADGRSVPEASPKIQLITGRRLDGDPEREEMFQRFSMADGMLYKPFRLEDLVERVSAMLLAPPGRQTAGVHGGVRENP